LFRSNTDLRDEQQRSHLLAEFSESIPQISLDLLQLRRRFRHRELPIKIDAQPRFRNVRVRQPRLDSGHFHHTICVVFRVSNSRIAVVMPPARIRAGRALIRPLPNKHEVELHAGADRCSGFLTLQSRHRLPQQLTVEFEPNANNVSALFGAEQVACAT